MPSLDEWLFLIPYVFITYSSVLICTCRWDKEKYQQSPSFERTGSTYVGYRNKCKTARRTICISSIFCALWLLVTNAALAVSEELPFHRAAPDIAYSATVLLALYLLCEVFFANLRLKHRNFPPQS